MDKEESLKKGAELVLLEFAPETQVRLMRVIIYTGTYERVKHQIAQSLTVGTLKTNPSLGPRSGDVALEVFQGDYEVINE